jgi:hypothetical protein
MNLARAIKSMIADPSISCLAVVRDGKTGYVELVRTPAGALRLQSGVTRLEHIKVPFRLDDLDDSQRELVATLAIETEWSAFRAGVPLEDEEASARPKKKARRTK